MHSRERKKPEELSSKELKEISRKTAQKKREDIRKLSKEEREIQDKLNTERRRIMFEERKIKALQKDLAKLKIDKEKELLKVRRDRRGKIKAKKLYVLKPIKE